MHMHWVLVVNSSPQIPLPFPNSVSPCLHAIFSSTPCVCGWVWVGVGVYVLVSVGVGISWSRTRVIFQLYQVSGRSIDWMIATKYIHLIWICILQDLFPNVLFLQ